MSRSMGLGRHFFPHRASQVLPHNFALLVRKGPGFEALLASWRGALERMRAQGQQPDDQWALALSLRRLYCGAGGGAQSLNASVGRLKEWVAAGFKSASKRCLGFFPRYTRVLTRPVLVTHSARPFPWNLAVGAPRNACELLNTRAHTPRVAVLPAKGVGYRLAFNASACTAALLRARRAVSSRVARILCGELPRTTAAGVHAGGRGQMLDWSDLSEPLSEPFVDFFARTSRLRKRFAGDAATTDGQCL